MAAMAKHVTILGGGLAGMSCALACARDGVPVTVLEREEEVGGLARSFSLQGFTYDMGPHRFLIHEPEAVTSFGRLLGQSLLHKERRSRIFLQGRFFHYPLRVGNAIFSMPPRTTARILADYALARTRGLVRPSQDRSFEEWVASRFGRTLYEIFFKQYTEKAWGIPCSRISSDWASQRISLLSLWDTFVKSVWKRGDQPRTYASRFYYPQHGGIGALSRAMAHQVEAAGGTVRRGQTVSGIEIENGRVRRVHAGGETLDVDEVVSTLPLGDLAAMVAGGAPDPVAQAASGLRFRAIVFVYLFVRRPRISDDHWIYLPEERFLSNRFSESVNFSTKNAPMGKTVLCAEVTCDVGDATWRTSDDVLAERVAGDIMQLGFAEVTPGEILRVATRRAREAYPIYDIGYRERVERVLGWFGSLDNLLSIGRSALFRYNNMDHSIEMGRKAAEAVLGRAARAAATEIATEKQYFG